MFKGIDYRKLDWPLILCYLVLALIGWISIFSAVYDEEHSHILDITQRYGMQFIWIVSSFVIAFFVLFIIDPKLYSTFAWPIYGASLLVLIAVIFFGIEVSGSKSWFEIGPLRFQPAEVSKIATAFAFGSLLSTYNFKMSIPSNFIKVILVITVPMGIIILQQETGSALVYLAFSFMLYREGMSGWYITLGIFAVILFLVTLSTSPFVAMIVAFSFITLARGVARKQTLYHLLFLALYLPAIIYSPFIGRIHQIADFITVPAEGWLGVVMAPPLIYHFVSSLRNRVRSMWTVTISFLCSIIFIFSVEIFFEQILQQHQKARIENLLGINVDLKGAGYNVHQSKIAIGSGGFTGKGFLNGTQTKFNFVPEQSTDFIFCTIGEEWGFLGSSLVILIYIFMIIRIILLSEKQKDLFNRIFGYSLASVLFMHFFVNIGMTMGIVPVIGIPLPFISYGGSSMWSFTLFLFIFIRLDLDRWR